MAGVKIMENLENQKHEQLNLTNEQITELYGAVKTFLDNFGKENALYPTRAYLQIESEQLRKLAQIFYGQLKQ